MLLLIEIGSLFALVILYRLVKLLYIYLFHEIKLKFGILENNI